MGRVSDMMIDEMDSLPDTVRRLERQMKDLGCSFRAAGIKAAPEGSTFLTDRQVKYIVGCMGELADYFETRMDADLPAGSSSYIGNAEMNLYGECMDVMKLFALVKHGADK